MKILAIDTASSTCSAAVCEDFKVIASCGLNNGKTHSQSFLPMTEEMLKKANLKLNEMSALAVTVGPGSFTGIRIGIATAKAWGQSLKLPLIPIITLEALALGMNYEGLCCPVLDARKNEVYTAIYRGKEQLVAPMAIMPEMLCELLQKYNEPILFNGDAATVYEQCFKSALAERFVLAIEEKRLFMAEAAALLGCKYFTEGKSINAEKLEAFYLRASGAEQQRMAQNG